jgi:hypothetical protein
MNSSPIFISDIVSCLGEWRKAKNYRRLITKQGLVKKNLEGGTLSWVLNSLTVQYLYKTNIHIM